MANLKVTVQVFARNLKTPRTLTVQQCSRCAQAARSADKRRLRYLCMLGGLIVHRWGAAEQLQFEKEIAKGKAAEKKTTASNSYGQLDR